MILSLQDLTIGYGERILSRGIEASLEKGSVVGLLGPNGSGKSTLLKAIVFGDERLSGEICVNGNPLDKSSPQQRAKQIAFVASKLPENLAMTVEEFVSMGRLPHLGPFAGLRENDKKRVKETLAHCELAGYKHRNVATLSDGEKQRAMLAMALAQETPIVLLDEPTSHLDPAYRIELFLLLRKLATTTERTFLLATHEVSLATQWCDALWLLDKEGHFYQGIPEELAINGTIAKLFDTDRYRFDAFTGYVELRYAKRAIKLLCDNEEPQKYIWTKRMLERLGYTLATESELSVRLSPQGWVITNGNGASEVCNSLSELSIIAKQYLNP